MMERPTEDPIERAALRAADPRMPSCTPPRGPTEPKIIELSSDPRPPPWGPGAAVGRVDVGNEPDGALPNGPDGAAGEGAAGAAGWLAVRSCVRA